MKHLLSNIFIFFLLCTWRWILHSNHSEIPWTPRSKMTEMAVDHLFAMLMASSSLKLSTDVWSAQLSSILSLMLKIITMLIISTWIDRMDTRLMVPSSHLKISPSMHLPMKKTSPSIIALITMAMMSHCQVLRDAARENLLLVDPIQTIFLAWMAMIRLITHHRIHRHTQMLKFKPLELMELVPSNLDTSLVLCVFAQSSIQLYRDGMDSSAVLAAIASSKNSLCNRNASLVLTWVNVLSIKEPSVKHAGSNDASASTLSMNREKKSSWLIDHWNEILYPRLNQLHRLSLSMTINRSSHHLFLCAMKTAKTTT